ncbi:uncharacterized protein E0L32_004954 [Thyridium curvatum]|uniref:Clr5 domain-containing protein n=1 Tax=Thyridium curvatum TaxID=1093900 RepID=A0A507AVL8_9PEZI|nr:uncharacterized protein E0L32_004954 [Thyridium curvatum]TPX14845.1 hypothetical protein E0L32_004954 [Thyridium curvatum]
MDAQYQFRASTRAYRKRLQEWGISKYQRKGATVSTVTSTPSSDRSDLVDGWHHFAGLRPTTQTTGNLPTYVVPSQETGAVEAPGSDSSLGQAGTLTTTESQEESWPSVVQAGNWRASFNYDTSSAGVPSPEYVLVPVEELTAQVEAQAWWRPS